MALELVLSANEYFYRCIKLKIETMKAIILNFSQGFN